jgi:hypothetical protein
MSLPISTRNNVAAAASVNSARDTRPAQAGPVQVIYRFDSEAYKKTDGVLGTGIGAQRDNTHQLVQQQDASGKWQVHVQAVNSGRINPSGYVFTSNRPVTVKDFNNPDSVLSQKAREATKRLNADSNRLPEASAPKTPAAAPAKKMSTVEWLGQQGRNTVGGVTAAVTSTAGMVGSLPEKAGRFAGSVGDLGRASINMVTGGQVAKSARNPMVINANAKSRSGPTNAEKGMSWAQGGINKAIGADAGSMTYKTVEVVAPLVFAGKGKTGGNPVKTQGALPASAQSGPIAGQKLLPAARATGPEGLRPTGQGTTQAGSGAAATPKTVKMTRTQPQPGNPVANPAIRASNSPVRVVKAADGSVKLSKANGQPASLPEVVRAVANGRITPKQLKQAQFDDASIKGIVRDAAQLKGSTGAKPASTPLKNSKASELPAEILSNVQQTVKGPEFQKRLADSNSKGEVARQNQAIKDMRANGKLTNSHTRPEGDGRPGSAHNEPQPQRQAKPENTAPRETQYADGEASKPQLNVKPVRAEMNLKPGSPPSNSKPAGQAQAAGAQSAIDQVTKQLGSPELQAALAESKSPETTRRANEAITAMQNDAMPTYAKTRPVPVTPLDSSTGELAQTFGQNLNPTVRTIVKGIEDQSKPMGKYNASTSDSVFKSSINDLLSRSGINPTSNPKAADNILTMAKGLNVDPMQLANQLIRKTRDANEQVSHFNPQNPLLIDGSKPQTIAAGVQYMSNLLAQGVVVPAQQVPVTVESKTWDLSKITRGVAVPAQQIPVTDNSKTWDVSKKAGLHTTAMNSDIDGPFAASYGQQGVDVQIKDLKGKETRLHLKLPQAIKGTPTSLSAPTVGYSSPVAILRYEASTTNRTGTRSVVIPITREQQQQIQSGDPASMKMNYVEGLSARLFSPESVGFWQQVSQRNARGGEYPGGVKSPSIVFNTFGSHGAKAFDNAAELVTSFARSLPPRSLPSQVEPGIFDAPNVRVYSGGTTLNEKGTSTPIGLSAQQQQSMNEVAKELPKLVEKYSLKYGLSKEATSAWQSSIFANPDIPSIIVPKKTVSEFSNRTAASHPGKTFADMQQEIERDVSALVTQKNMGSFIQLHHTPSAPGDTVALHKPAVVDANVKAKESEFTTEWQFAVKGQKAMPVLDAVANDLKKNFNIDLKAELERQGHSYGAIRNMSLDETVNLLSGFVRDTINRQAQGQQVTPRVIVPVDTYYEKGGKIDGSDASLIRSAAGLYTPGRTHVIQVDTGVGKETVGRSPQFKLGTDARGNATLEPVFDNGKGPVNPNGPNGALAPTVYARSASDMGDVFNQAYRNQSPLSADEVARVKNRQ